MTQRHDYLKDIFDFEIELGNSIQSPFLSSSFKFKFYLGDAKIKIRINVTRNEPNVSLESFDSLRVNIDDESSEQVSPLLN